MLKTVVPSAIGLPQPEVPHCAPASTVLCPMPQHLLQDFRGLGLLQQHPIRSLVQLMVSTGVAQMDAQGIVLSPPLPQDMLKAMAVCRGCCRRAAREPARCRACRERGKPQRLVLKQGCPFILLYDCVLISTNTPPSPGCCQQSLHRLHLADRKTPAKPRASEQEGVLFSPSFLIYVFCSSNWMGLNPSQGKHT